MLSDSITLDLDGRFSHSSSSWMGWLVCLSAGLFFFYEFFQLNLFDVINQPLRVEFHIDAAELSWMSSSYLWADILFLLPAGVILDRYSTRLVILMAMSVCIIGTVGFALTYSFAWATFFHFLSGIGNAFCFLSCVVLVSRWFPPRRQALVIGCLVTMAFIGGMMAHTPLAYLNDRYGWRYSLLIDGSVGVLLFLWIVLFVRDKPDDEQCIIKAPKPSSGQQHHTLLKDPSSSLRAPSPRSRGEGNIDKGRYLEGSSQTSSPNFVQALANPQNWLAGLYTSCLNLPIMVICALWGASYLQVVHQLPQMAASNIVSLIFFGSILGCPLMGWLSDTLGRRKPLMIIGALATFFTVIPLFMGIALSNTVLSVLFFALGVFTSTQVISYPLIAESNSGCNTGAATGIASVIIMGGGGVGQVLFGWLMQRHAGMVTAQYSIADFQYAMWMFPIAVIVALLAILFTRETYCERCN